MKRKLSPTSRSDESDPASDPKDSSSSSFRRPVPSQPVEEVESVQPEGLFTSLVSTFERGYYTIHTDMRFRTYPLTVAQLRAVLERQDITPMRGYQMLEFYSSIESLRNNDPPLQQDHIIRSTEGVDNHALIVTTNKDEVWEKKPKKKNRRSPSDIKRARERNHQFHFRKNQL